MLWWAVPARTFVLIRDTNWAVHLEGSPCQATMAPHKTEAQNRGRATEGQKRGQERLSYPQHFSRHLLLLVTRWGKLEQETERPQSLCTQEIQISSVRHTDAERKHMGTSYDTHVI